MAKKQDDAPPVATAEAVQVEQAQPVATPSDQELIGQLAEIAARATPEQRQLLQRLGVALPEVDMAKAAAGQHQLGLRCSKCNEIALYFIGTKFQDVNGTWHDEPQPGMQTHQVPWTQDLPADQINRRRPQCQCCHQRVPLEGDGSFRIRDRGTVSRVVEVKTWRQSRDQSFDKAKIRKLMAQMKMPPDVPVGEQPARQEQMSETIERMFGKEAVNAINLIGQRLGVGD